jgi:hypothetical protein
MALMSDIAIALLVERIGGQFRVAENDQARIDEQVFGGDGQRDWAGCYPHRGQIAGCCCSSDSKSVSPQAFGPVKASGVRLRFSAASSSPQ